MFVPFFELRNARCSTEEPDLRTARTVSHELHRQQRIDRERSGSTGEPVQKDKSADAQSRGTARKRKKGNKADQLKPWSSKTCLVVTDPDLLDAEAYDELLSQAAARGDLECLLLDYLPEGSFSLAQGNKARSHVLTAIYRNNLPGDEPGQECRHCGDVFGFAQFAHGDLLAFLFQKASRPNS